MTSASEYAVTAPLWRWQGKDGTAWFFVSVQGVAGEALSATALMHRLETGKRSGFGAVKVTIRIGDSQWRTSAFPMKAEGWSIPVKAAVRKAEGLSEGVPVELTIAF